MPNGRSGGFRISVGQVRQLLGSLTGDAVVGELFGHGGAVIVTASQFAQRVDQHDEEDVPVEEQDHSWYIAHLGADHTNWVVIEENSPLYEGFRQCHEEWRKKQSEQR
jgi:hypothetical protein